VAAEVVLTGKIDKMEILNDYNEVNVVDYKTGKPKSRGVIEGTTKDSEGGIKRQLAFYNLLLNKYENGKYKMVSGDIDFIEPTESGAYKKESFTVTEQDVTELEQEILRVADEILTLKFWDRKCEDPKCEFCALRYMLAEEK
jgi:RecB family exonuclease